MLNDDTADENAVRRRFAPAIREPLKAEQKCRKRLVTFRLTLGEYAEVEKALLAEGSWSLSEFARAAIMQRVQARRPKAVSLGDDLLTLSTKLEQLDSALVELSGNIRRVLGFNCKKE